MDTDTLTPRQQQILTLVQTSLERHGYPPTRAEIARELGFRSANAAEEHLKALARKGVLRLTPGASRGIRVTAAQSGEAARRRGLSRGGAGAQVALPGLGQLALPLIGRVAAGAPVLAAQHVERTVTVPSVLFQQAPDYLLRVKGMSMVEAGILDGDLLAVRKTEEARDGTIVVARLGDEVTVKRLRRQGTRITLQAHNPAFAPIEVSSAHGSFAIEGIVVGLIRDQGVS